MNDSDGYNIGKQLAHIIADDDIIKIAKKKRRKLSAWEKAKAVAPLAGIGGVLGLSKGLSEKSIEKGIERVMQKRKKIRKNKKINLKGIGTGMKKKLPWGIARGLTGSMATVVISLSMMDMMKRFKRRAEAGTKIRNKR